MLKARPGSSPGDELSPDSSRCQDLEMEVKRHDEEEERRKIEVLGRFKARAFEWAHLPHFKSENLIRFDMKAGYDSILRSQEQEHHSSNPEF